MDQFLEDFDDDEIRTFFLGNEQKPVYVCVRCKQEIVTGGPDRLSRITITNRSNESIHLHEKCFDELFRELKTDD